MDKQISVSNFSKTAYNGATEYNFILSLSIDTEELPWEDYSVIREFIRNSECFEDNKEWLQNGGTLEVVLEKIGSQTSYRIGKV